MQQNVCKICRRAGQKLFLKGEKCLGPKCPMVKRPYPPGPKKKRTSTKLSEYGKELREKQKMKNFYNIREKQFRKTVLQVLQKRGKVEDASLLLIRSLETRLDNVIFRLGFAKSRKEARQLVSHGYFLVDSKPVNIPSFRVKKGMVISFRENKKKKDIFKNIVAILKNYQPPSWLKLDKKEVKAEVVAYPSSEDLGLPVEIPSIFEFYSR
ncbi:30S ribosomal protein S4 [bacterium]|nr:30S ribosomal protein S4 [bacterium]